MDIKREKDYGRKRTVIQSPLRAQGYRANKQKQGILLLKYYSNIIFLATIYQKR